MISSSGLYTYNYLYILKHSVLKLQLSCTLKDRRYQIDLFKYCSIDSSWENINLKLHRYTYPLLSYNFFSSLRTAFPMKVGSFKCSMYLLHAWMDSVRSCFSPTPFLSFIPSQTFSTSMFFAFYLCLFLPFPAPLSHLFKFGMSGSISVCQLPVPCARFHLC